MWIGVISFMTVIFSPVVPNALINWFSAVSWTLDYNFNMFHSVFNSFFFNFLCGKCDKWSRFSRSLKPFISGWRPGNSITRVVGYCDNGLLNVEFILSNSRWDIFFNFFCFWIFTTIFIKQPFSSQQLE